MNLGFGTNMILIVLIVAAVIFLLLIKVLGKSKENKEDVEEQARADFQIPVLLTIIKKRMNTIVTEDLYIGNPTADELNRRKRRRYELKDALKNCNTGDIASKIYVREYIYDLLTNEMKIDDEKVNWAIPFDEPDEMSARYKFETLLYLAEKKHEMNALSYLIETYSLNAPKKDAPFSITTEEINKVYKAVVRGRALSFDDKMRVLVQVIYSHYLGLGVIDKIRDMKIDGVSGGVSGLPSRMAKYMASVEDFGKETKELSTTMNSVWIMYKGDSIHLPFLSYEHEAELRRIVTIAYKYGYPGQLSETRPYIINEMHDGSRVVVVRPKLSESWTFFIRKKMDAGLMSLEDLFPQKNSELIIGTLYYILRGESTTALSGAQGSGKTTLLMAIIKYIDATLNLRVQETAFEANLRSLYPERNILTFQETDTVSGQNGLDLQKKTDGDVTIVSEVATDPVAAWAVQSAQVGSRFMLFTHHGMTFSKLVEAMRNSMLKIGMFSNENIAEQQVVGMLDFDVHLDKRIMMRITECIAVSYDEEAMDFNEIQSKQSQEDKMSALMEVMTTYFRQQTRRKQYIENNIIEYRNGAYVATNKISAERQKRIESFLSDEEKVEFREFIQKHWGN